jgi:hypothetical protein
MDGEFISLNKSFINSPSSSPLYSLYHVKESVVFASKDYAETLTHVKSTQDKETHELVDVTKFKQAIQHYYPAFEDTFEIKGHTTTIRTKMVNKDANRECVMCQNERYINILSGKISSIFEASEAVQQAIESRSVYSVNK